MHSWKVASKIINALGEVSRFLVTFPVWVAVVPFCAVAELAATLFRAVARRMRPPREKVPRIATEGGELTYLLSSLFLRECREKLTPTANEEMCAVTGVAVDDHVLVPSVLVPVNYERSSPGGVAAKLSSSHARLKDMGRHGHTLQAMFHSHPGSGPSSVRESRTDVAAQERFERAGYRVITGIFSRDGYVRFFANGVKFKVQVYGNGVKEVGRNVFKLEELPGSILMRDN